MTREQVEAMISGTPGSEPLAIFARALLAAWDERDALQMQCDAWAEADIHKAAAWDALQAEVDRLKVALDKEFNRGYLIACCNVHNLHDEPGIACDVLAEASITRAEVKSMSLSEYDATALKEIRSQRQRDPIERSKPRAAITP